MLILAPILIVVVTAFSPTDYFQFPPPGLSLRWFVEFFRLDNMRNAFTLSLELALLSATLATVLGTLGALFLARRRGVVASLLQSLFLAPLVFPTIILGLALLLLYKTLGVPVFPGLLLAHCVIGMPYCFRTVLASVQALDPALEEAGQSLGAGPLDTLFLVTLPLIWQGVLSGWLFAFIVSFGELNTALFLSGPGIDHAADRDLQLSAVPGKPARDRRRVDDADRADRADGGGDRTDRRHGPHHPVALTRAKVAGG